MEMSFKLKEGELDMKAMAKIDPIRVRGPSASIRGGVIGIEPFEVEFKKSHGGR